ncbi:hypothetical protein B0J14DRAFT_656988 [Halenospora varia]|nr:hypothetical protein B0J14DRAFT_656988 [Halenospora varia]
MELTQRRLNTNHIDNMPPKKTVATAAPTALAAAGINLSVAEIKMLAAVVTEMGQVPEINYTAVGERVGIKLARNARTSAKKVFTKIIEAQATADAAADAEEEAADEAIKKKPARKAPAARKSVEEKDVDKKVLTKKVAVKKVANKEPAGSKTPSAGKVAVGARAAPKKASAGMTKKAPAKKGGKKAGKEEEQVGDGEETKDEEMKNVADEEPVAKAETDVEAMGGEVPEGKSPLSQVDQDIPDLPKLPEVPKLEEPKNDSDPQAAPVAPANASEPWVSTYFGFTATFPAGYAFPEDATPTEIYQAHAHEITVEAYRVWKADNQYDDDLAPSPLLAAQVQA